MQDRGVLGSGRLRRASRRVASVAHVADELVHEGRVFDEDVRDRFALFGLLLASCGGVRRPAEGGDEPGGLGFFSPRSRNFCCGRMCIVVLAEVPTAAVPAFELEASFQILVRICFDWSRGFPSISC